MCAHNRDALCVKGTVAGHEPTLAPNVPSQQEGKMRNAARFTFVALLIGLLLSCARPTSVPPLATLPQATAPPSHGELVP
jgi:hypothetical protein